MRLSILPVLLTGASIVGLVAAEPIRVIESPSNANANIRFGHALANANVNSNDDDVARITRPIVPVVPVPQDNDNSFPYRFCGASLREKALRVSNAFRYALGLPPVEANIIVARPGELHIFPVGYRSHSVLLGVQEELDEEGKPRKHDDNEHPDHHGDGEDHGHHHGHHGHHPHKHHKHHKSFLKRIHRAIKALGPWEGRAVAFVLGCGIGVLLRMFWVLTVLAYRTVRGEHEETLDAEYFVYEQAPETLFVAPPQYVDEKVKTEVHEEGEEHK